MARVRPYDSEGGGGGDRTTQLAFYNVELRAPIGAFDGGTQSAMVPSVLINAAPDWRIFGQTGGGRGMSRGEHIWLLDMAPAITDTGGGRGGGSRNGTAHSLVAGQTFQDPAGGVSITTEAVTATSATIRVDISGAAGVGGMTGGGGAAGATPMMAPPTLATCLDDTPLIAPGPAECGGSYAGMAGMGGTGGLAGSGGLAGGGAGGAGGIAGGTTLGGSGGSVAGAGAVAGMAGGNQVVTQDAELESGCGCRVPGDRGAGRTAGALALLGIVAAVLGRRRRINLPDWV
jgi:MYXO-CTERM domain-containing protein